MKIFNNFDTQLMNTTYKEKIKEYWKENILLIQRSKYFFFIKVLIQFIVYTTIYIILSIIIVNLEQLHYIYIIEIFFFLIYLVAIWFLVVHNLIHYKFDFSIATPKWIITYKQNWILDWKFKELPSSKIRAFESSRTWLLWNILWYWYIDIISDWALANKIWKWHSAWRVRLEYVNFPNKTREQIIKICIKS